MTQPTYMIDPDDFCRQCKGLGKESDGTGGTVYCDQCDGTGYRTVRVTIPAERARDE